MTARFWIALSLLAAGAVVPQSLLPSTLRRGAHAEAAVALVNFEDGVSVVVGADHHVVMKMDAALGDAGGTGRVKPEGGVVL